jgi:hypothetical protein
MEERLDFAGSNNNWTLSMPTRRQFLHMSLAAATVLAGRRAFHAHADGPAHHLFVPLAAAPLEPTPTPEPIGEGPILAPPSGTTDQAYRYIAARANQYVRYDVAVIVRGYATIGGAAEMDWFLALAQCAHETGSLTSWWCARPRRNPAGLGVTGKIVKGDPNLPPPEGAWVWDPEYRDQRWAPEEPSGAWREGLSFAGWVEESIPAHIGRLLAYALPAGAGTPYQQQLIDYALALRPLPADYRGIAPTIIGLNGRWAYPGETYGQSILDLARRMREA